MKKLFSIVATLALLAGFVPQYTSAAYSAELEDAYGYAFNMGITTQSSIENADMYGTLTRVALAKMISNYVLELGLQTPDTSKTCNFTDVSSALDTQYANGVTNACQLGLMGVGISTFRPFDTVTRAEFGTVLSRAIWGDANNGSDPYYVAHLNALKDEGVMNDISNPSAKEVRGYVMLMMQRADENGVASGKPAICSTPENILACSLELDSCPAECKETEVAKPGLASVSLVGSATTSKVPQNVKSYKVGTIKLTAGENDTTVSFLTVTRSNLGTPSAVTSMQLAFANGTMATVSSTAMTNTTQSKSLRFSPSLVLKAGSSVELDLLATLNETAANQNSIHDFAVTAINVVDGTATGTPLKVGTLETTSYSAGNVTLAGFDAQPSITIGKADQQLATVDLRANRDYTVKGFTINKTAGEDFSKVFADVKAYYNGSVVGNVMIDAEKITVSNLNVEKLNGETANLELRGKAIYVGSGITVGAEITTDDQFVVEKSSGFPMTALTGLSDNFTLTTVDINLQKTTTGSTTVAPGTSSVKLFEGVITSSTEFDVSSWTMALDTTVAGSGTITGNFVDNTITAYINGVDYEMSDAGLTKTATADRFRVTPGEVVTVKVVGNVLSSAKTGANYKFKFQINDIKNVSNGTTTTVNKSVLGDVVTVGNGGFTLTKPTSIPSNKTVLEGSSADVLYFNLRANSEDQVLKSLNITSTTGGLFKDYATEVALMQGTTKVKSFTNETDLSGTSLLFDSLSTTLKKDITTPFTVRVTLKAGEVENLGSKIQLGIAATGDVKIVRSVNQTIYTNTSSTTVAGNQYQIASAAPTVALPTQDGKNTIISFASKSNYDVNILSATVEMTRNLNNGTFVNWSGSVAVKDAINGSVVGTGGNVPGQVTLQFANLTVDTAAVDRVLELVDPANTVTDADYTVTVKDVTYRYVDRNDSGVSKIITESYNVAK